MVINIDLFFLNDGRTLSYVYNNENGFFNIIFLNRSTQNGIRATIEVENIEISIEEDYNNISINLRILNNIVDEDSSEWNNDYEPIADIPIRWYNDNHVEDTENWYSD